MSKARVQNIKGIDYVGTAEKVIKQNKAKKYMV